LLEAFKRIACLRWEGSLLVSLAFAEHDERSCFEVEVTPVDATSPFVVRIAKHLGTTDARVGE
jgi:hypothetical protein